MIGSVRLPFAMDRTSLAYAAAIAIGGASIVLTFVLVPADKTTFWVVVVWASFAFAAFAASAVGAVLGVRGWDLGKVAAAAVGSPFVLFAVALLAIVALSMLTAVLSIPMCILHHVFGIGSDSWCDP